MTITNKLPKRLTAHFDVLSAIILPMELDSTEDCPLARFNLARLTADPAEYERLESNPIIHEGAFVSMPYLIGADDQSHERYRQDRLFTLRQIVPGTGVTIDVQGVAHALVLDVPIVLTHGSERIRVTLTDFTSRQALHQSQDV